MVSSNSGSVQLTDRALASASPEVDKLALELRLDVVHGNGEAAACKVLGLEEVGRRLAPEANLLLHAGVSEVASEVLTASARGQ